MAGASSGAHIPRSVPEAFDDLVVRFLNNLPEEELRNSERLFFQVNLHNSIECQVHFG